MKVQDEATVEVGQHDRGGEHHDGGEHELPHETLAPITLAAGIALLGFGLLTSLVFSIVGIATIGWALAVWIGEMRHG
jgi:hypothetical protein